MLRDEEREVNHHGRIRKMDADGNEVTVDTEDSVSDLSHKPETIIQLKDSSLFFLHEQNM